MADSKTVNSTAYDSLAAWYLQWTTSTPSPRQRYIRSLLSLVRSRPHILELGCGPGIPVLRLLLDEGCSVVANDISSVQIGMARERCPTATFVPGDMTRLDFEKESFDGAICFFAIFHLPRGEQKGMLRRIFDWIRPGGVFVVNFATVDEEEIHGEMMGRGMFWSSFGVEESRGMLKEVGFEVVQCEEVVAGDGELEEGDPDYGTSFAWMLARKPGEMQSTNAKGQ
ncbi:hypothetical protein CAC42_2333 [Sphaceloma murrayae]|uniref:Methyltransferase domain-containing protein n=1 Tax=Sphaceloma murrayae TaxID=2082308 RepID=A0A2K1QIV4_9PEZI|nr:hypothetical protein CAC42_2333 [Sphaceloma murrayae]